MMAAISAYPELTDVPKDSDEPFFGPICPCKDEVYSFIKDVIDEVVSIFPSQYIHIGSDEVDKTAWKKSELCKQLMEKENMADANKLQDYFVHRVQNIIESKDRKMICWDEVLDGGIDSSVNIMYWRGWTPDAPMRATLNGNHVIMSPTNPLYFDAFPDNSSLRNVYNMTVVYNNVPNDKRYLIKGSTGKHVDRTYTFRKTSRLHAFSTYNGLSEREFGPTKTYLKSYSQRLLAHYSILDKMGIAYRLPDVSGFAMESVYVGNGIFDIKSPLADKKIHYTTDGSIPTKQSPILKKPLTIKKPVTIKFSLFSENTAKGDINTVNYKESTYSTTIQTPQTIAPGLTCDFYNQSIYKTSEISGNPDKQIIVNNVTVPAEAQAPRFGLKYNGYINVPQKGIYSFYLTCDDGGMLYIADRLVIENEGPHSPIEKSGQVALEKGLHPFHLDFVEAGSGYTLLLQYSVNGSKVKDVPDNWFVH